MQMQRLLRKYLENPVVVAGIALCVGAAFFFLLVAVFRPDGWLLRQFGNAPASATTALTLIGFGIVVIGWNIHTMVGNVELELKLKRKRYQLASSIYFVTQMNDEIFSILKQRSREGSSIEIIEGDEDPPWFSVFRNERRNEYE